jgi:hypothetical protein
MPEFEGYFFVQASRLLRVNLAAKEWIRALYLPPSYSD